MIDASQIARVQESFLALLPITDRAAADFYAALFARAPDTRALFSHDMTEQGRKLFATLATVVDGLDRLDSIVPVAQELARRHVRYGVQTRHYDAVGAALIDMLRRHGGPGFDAATEGAWAAAYAVLSSTMIDASRRAA